MDPKKTKLHATQRLAAVPAIESRNMLVEVMKKVMANTREEAVIRRGNGCA
jgi:hypothetical protein